MLKLELYRGAPWPALIFLLTGDQTASHLLLVIGSWKVFSCSLPTLRIKLVSSIYSLSLPLSLSLILFSGMEWEMAEVGSLFLQTFSQHDVTGLFVWSRDSPFLFCPARFFRVDDGIWSNCARGGGLNRGEKCDSVCSSDWGGDLINRWGMMFKESWFWFVSNNFEPKRTNLYLSRN